MVDRRGHVRSWSGTIPDQSAPAKRRNPYSIEFGQVVGGPRGVYLYIESVRTCIIYYILFILIHSYNSRLVPLTSLTNRCARSVFVTSSPAPTPAQTLTSLTSGAGPRGLSSGAPEPPLF